MYFMFLKGSLLLHQRDSGKRFYARAKINPRCVCGDLLIIMISLTLPDKKIIHPMCLWYEKTGLFPVITDIDVF